MINFNQSSLNTNSFFIQKILNLKIIPDRKTLFLELCKNKKVLHVGCTDHPFQNYMTGLHWYLYNNGVQNLDGMDVDIEGLSFLKNVVPGNYYSDLKEIKDEYDIILVPETIEHVANIQIFVQELSNLNFKKMLITAPCFFLEMKNNEFGMIGNDYYEIVHPDHKMWFTPYTLKNCITQFSNLSIEDNFILENGHMVGILTGGSI